MILVAAILTLAGAFGAAILLELESVWELILATFVLSIAEIVLVVEALSLARWVTQTNVLVAQGALLLLVGIALLARRPHVPRLGRSLLPRSSLHEHPLLLLLLVFAMASLGYELALVFFTPPNNWDSMAYHLSRAAAWYQHHGVSYVDAHTARENAFPPNAEILVLYTFVFSHSDRYAAVWQWAASPASMLAIGLLARRIGFTRAQALFAALIFVCLSQVALQSITTQNDLITASLIVSTAAFLSKRARPRLWLSSLSFALALGTKLTALFALPVLIAISALMLDRRDRKRLLLCVVVSTAAVASFGFVLNVVRAGSLLGARSATAPYAQTSATGVARTIGYTLLALMGDLRGLPVAPANEDLSFFGPLGIVLVVPLIVATLRRWRSGRATAVEGVLALALPAYLVALAFAYRWNPFVGRFLITPAALLAPLFATVYRPSRYATTVVGVAVIGVVSTLVFNHAKPLGLGGGTSIWTMARPSAQAVQRPPMRSVLSTIGRCIPDHSQIGFVLGNDDWDYPLFGPHLTRRLVRLRRTGTLDQASRAGLGWVLVRERLLVRPSQVGWRSLDFPASGLRLYWAPSRSGLEGARLRACEALAT